MVPLKYLSNFWRTLDMPLINCEINIILTWSKNCFIIPGAIENEVQKFAITDKKLYFSVDQNTKLLQQLKQGFWF